MKNIIDGFGFIYGNKVSSDTNKNNFGYINSIKLTKENGSDSSVVDISKHVGDTTEPSFAIFTPSKNLSQGTSDDIIVVYGDSSYNTSIMNSKEYNRCDISESYTPLKNINVDNTSYELLRTNPKLTGNIKVVIDSDNGIYIDTFKVNDALSKEKYRKVPVSYKDYYGSNVMSIFRNVQSKDLYDVPQKYHSLFTVTNNFNEQYVDMYRSGAAMNTDKMYRENYSLLAPLKVGEILPDFFVIYKIDNSPSWNMSGTDTMKYLIKNGKQIAFFDFREGTKLGTYLRNIQDGAKDFVGEAYIAKNGSDDDNHENIFCGISVDKGVVANIYESASFNTAKNQVGYDNYFSKAYERNRLVSPNIINFEYMFDDEDENQFSINTYFGLYIKFNPLSENVYCFDASKDSTGDVIKTQNYVFKRDGKFVQSTDNIYSVEFSDDIISAYTSKDWIRRRTLANRYDMLDDTLPSLKNKYCVGENLLSLDTKEVFSQNASTTYASFITITLNDILQNGEHLKVICHTSNKNLHSDNIYEVILSDASLYAKDPDCLSDEIINYYTHTYKTSGGMTYSKDICIHRVCYYFEELIGESKESAIKRQISGIHKAFKKFTDCPVKSLNANDSTFSIVEIEDNESPYSHLDFQRITPSILKGSEEITDESVYQEETDKVTYFGEYSISPLIVNPLIDDNTNRSWVYKEEDDLGFCPIDFEIMGTRLTYVIGFIDMKGYDVYEVNVKTPSDDIMYSQLYYIDDRGYTDGTPREAIPTEYDKFSLVYRSYNKTTKTVEKIEKDVNVVTSFKNTNLKLVKVKDSDGTGRFGTLSKINLYRPYELSYGICGILSVKDFDFTVMDGNGDKSEFITWYINTDSTALQTLSPNYVENVDYLKKEYEDGRRYNDISLLSPYCVKWKFFNTDAIGNPIKLYYTDSSYGITEYKNNVVLRDSSNASLVTDDMLDLSKLYKGSYIRNSIMNGSLSIHDIIYNTSIRTYKSIDASPIEHIKVYSVSGSDMEFIYRGTKVKINVKNEEVLNAQEVLNFNIYLYESVSCGNDNEWEVFVDKGNSCILIVHYAIQSTMDGNTISPVSVNEDNNNAIFMTGDTTTDEALLYFCRIIMACDSNDLYMDGSILKVASNDNEDVVIPQADNLCVIIHNEDFTIRGELNNDGNHDGNKLEILNPVIFISNGISNVPLTNDLLDNYCSGHKEIDIFAMSRQTGYEFSQNVDLSFDDVALFIKNEGEEYKDYTNMNTLSIYTESPLYIGTVLDSSIYYYQTYFVPETYDVFNFDDIETLPNFPQGMKFLNSKYANVVLSGVSNIPQMWIKKYSENTNYCFETTYVNKVKTVYPSRVSFSLVENYNPMMNPLYKTFNYTYTYNDTTETMMPYEGYRSGVLIKTFFNSLGLQLRSPKYNNVEITTWSQTKIKNKKFRFDVTNSLINMILNSAVFNELWNTMGINNTTYKLNFVKKTILPNINISTKDTITVFVNRYRNQGLRSSVASNIFINGMKEIKNIKVELINEGGNYYVEVTPDKTINGTYYIKYNIKL